MKKLILLPIIFLLIGFNANAVTGWDFIRWSFNATDSIESGSIQYIDVKIVGTYNGTTEIYFSIRKLDKSNNIEVFRENWLIYSDPTSNHVNPDGTVRAYFKIPSNYTSGQFEIYSISSSLMKYPKGLIKVSKTTDYFDEVYLKEYNSKYYDANGVDGVPIEGLYIKETNGKREKVFIAPN